MKHNQMNAKEFVIGAAVGSLLGGISALLIAPKSGKVLRQNLCDIYGNIADCTQDFASKSKSFAQNASNQTSHLAHKAKSAVQGKGWCCEEEQEECAKDLLIGSLVGGVLGAVVGLLMAPKSGEDLRQDIADTYEDASDYVHDVADNIGKKTKSFAKTANKKTNKWLQIAQQVVENLSDSGEDATHDLFNKAKDLIQNNRVHDVMDWASLGFRLWQGIKK